MILEFRLPDIGEGVAEGEVTQWLVADGDAVAEDQPIVEVMTDKATVEIPCPANGTVKRLVAEPGEVIPVGAVLLEIELPEGATAPKIASHGHGADDGAEKKRRAAAEKEAAEKAAADKAAAAKAAAEAAAGKAAAAKPAPAAASRPAGQRAIATPYTRRMAREKGVDIETVAGTGPAGRVTEDDVARAAAGGGTAATGGAAIDVAAPRPGDAMTGDEVIAIRGLRKKIYERMTVSKTRAAHFTYVDDVDVTDLVAIRKVAKERALLKGAKLTYLPFILKAIAEAFRDFPSLNATVDDEGGTFTIRRAMNMGIAVDTENGLIVPVVKDVANKGIIEIARDIERLATDARNGKSKLDDLQGGTFTVTNAGNIGGLFATPVINYPEVAILGVHKIAKTPRVVGDRIVVRDVMYLSISIDHRINDGAIGAHFMNKVKSMLENPASILVGEI